MPVKTNKAKSVLKNFGKSLLLPIVLYLLLLLLAGKRIGSWNTVVAIFVLSVVPTICAYGVAFGFVSGMMDFSVGSRMIVAGMCSVIGGHYFGLIGMLLGAILSSLLMALIVGGLFATLKIPSLVVSLGTLMVFEIVSVRIATGINSIIPGLSTGAYLRTPVSLTFLGTSPWNFIILIISAYIFRLLNYRTKFATQARMVGSDELIAANIGIKPMKVKFITFLYGSIFLGISAMVSASYSSAVGSKCDLASLSMVFKPMMAVIIGLSLQKFVDLEIGIFIGSLSMSIIFTGIIALGWPDSMQNVVLGLMMLIVMASPNVRRQYQDYKRRKKTRQMYETANAADAVL